MAFPLAHKEVQDARPKPRFAHRFALPSLNRLDLEGNADVSGVRQATAGRGTTLEDRADPTTHGVRCTAVKGIMLTVPQKVSD